MVDEDDEEMEFVSPEEFFNMLERPPKLIPAREYPDEGAGEGIDQKPNSMSEFKRYD